MVDALLVEADVVARLRGIGFLFWPACAVAGFCSAPTHVTSQHLSSNPCVRIARPALFVLRGGVCNKWRLCHQYGTSNSCTLFHPYF